MKVFWGELLADVFGDDITSGQPVVVDVSPGSCHIVKVLPENGSHLPIMITQNKQNVGHVNNTNGIQLTA